MFGVNVVSGGRDAINAVLYGSNSTPAMISQLDSQIATLKDKINVFGKTFVDNIIGMHNRYNGSEAIQYAKSLLGTTGISVSDNAIYRLTPDTILTMNNIMRRYIYSMPEVNKLDSRGLCYGFGHEFINTEPDTFGEDREDYQRVMDGVLQFTEDGDGVIKYYASSYDAEEDLHYLDKFNILDTWDVVANLIATGKDPTSPNLDDL